MSCPTTACGGSTAGLWFGGEIVETTETRVLYFGYELTAFEAALFCYLQLEGQVELLGLLRRKFGLLIPKTWARIRAAQHV
jgi:hypothetical protein